MLICYRVYRKYRLTGPGHRKVSIEIRTERPLQGHVTGSCGLDVMACRPPTEVYHLAEFRNNTLEHCRGIQIWIRYSVFLGDSQVLAPLAPLLWEISKSTPRDDFWGNSCRGHWHQLWGSSSIRCGDTGYRVWLWFSSKISKKIFVFFVLFFDKDFIFYFDSTL